MTLPRFYPILDTGLIAARNLTLPGAAEALATAGVGILQLRHKGDWTRDFYRQAQAVASICQSGGVRFFVNDRPDFALLLDAGVHVGQDDLPPSLVRNIIGSHRYLGYSTHNEAQLKAADREPADYLALGPIFSTRSKANPDPLVGTAELARLRPLTSKPLVAIGGITRENARQVWAAGADSIAVVADLYPEGCTEKTVRERAEEWTKLANE